MIKKLLLLVPFLIIYNLNNLSFAIDLKNTDEQISYSLGFMAAEHAKSKSPLGIKVNPNSFIQGFKDNLNNKSQMTQEQIIQSLNLIKEKQLELQKKYLDKNNQIPSTTESTNSNSNANSSTTTISPPTPVGSQASPTPVPSPNMQPPLDPRGSSDNISSKPINEPGKQATNYNTSNQLPPNGFNDSKQIEDNNLLINNKQNFKVEEISQNKLKFKEKSVEKNHKKDLAKTETLKNTNNKEFVNKIAKDIEPHRLHIAKNNNKEAMTEVKNIKDISKDIKNTQQITKASKDKDSSIKLAVQTTSSEQIITPTSKLPKEVLSNTNKETLPNNNSNLPSKSASKDKPIATPSKILPDKFTLLDKPTYQINLTSTEPTKSNQETPSNYNGNKKLDTAIKESAKLQQLLQSQEFKKPQDKLSQNKIPNQINLIQEFLEKNKKNKNVNELQSGLQYQVLNIGNQSEKSPIINDKVKVHYRGTLVNGTEFANSYSKQPIIFELKSVIKGWQEALTLMKPNAKWKIFVPPQLAYGGQKIGNIPENSILIFEMELLEIISS